MTAMDQYGPYPTDESQVTATVLYRHLLATTYRRYRGQDSLLNWAHTDTVPFGPKWQTYRQSVAALVAEWSLLAALRLVMQQLPEQADELARHLHDAWEDGSSFGEWLYEWAIEQGWDTDELEAAVDAEIAAVAQKAAERDRDVLTVGFGGPRPTIVCLCGSTRYPDALLAAARDEARVGRVVLGVHDFDRTISDEQKAAHDELHRRQIELADEVLVVNPNGYGESTRSEIAYARKLGKPVRFLEPPTEEKAE